MLFKDEISQEGGWVFLGNSDPDPQVGGGDNLQISFYRAPELYGPWSAQQVLITVEQVNQLPGVNVSVGIMERPKITQQNGYYYLFLHLEPVGVPIGVFFLSEQTKKTDSGT